MNLPFDDTHPPAFDGDTYDPAEDQIRLTGQVLRVYEVMRDGRWRGLRAIADATHDPEASVSARLRDLRKARFGGHELEHRRVTGGYWEYRLVVQARLF